MDGLVEAEHVGAMAAALEQAHLQTDKTLERLADSLLAAKFAAWIFALNRGPWRGEVKEYGNPGTTYDRVAIEDNRRDTYRPLWHLVTPGLFYPQRTLLDQLGQYAGVAKNVLAEVYQCQAHVSVECEHPPDCDRLMLRFKYFTYKRGQNICAAKVCWTCYRMFADDGPLDQLAPECRWVWNDDQPQL
jgi:hypothetical protein